MVTSRALFALFLAFILCLSACASRPLIINNALDVDTIGICLNFDEGTHDDEKLLYLNAVKEFVDYSRIGENENSLVDTCKRDQTYQLNILVQNSKFVDPSEQVFYVLLSTVGIMYPLSGGGIGFFWFGLNSTSVEVSLSESLSGDGKPVYRQVYSSPYFMDSESLRIHHMENFKHMISGSLQQIGSQLKSRPELKTDEIKG